MTIRERLERLDPYTGEELNNIEGFPPVNQIREGAGMSLNEIANESSRIAVLTTGAIGVSGQKVIDDIEALVAESEAAAKRMREEADNVIASIRQQTAMLSDQVNAYVGDCQSAIEVVKGIRLTNGNGSGAAEKLHD